MKRFLGALLLLCILLGMLPTTVFAASTVTVFNITVTAPMGGEKPVYSATLPATASTEVVRVEWTGTFASDGTFVDGRNYTVLVTVRIKEGQDKTIKYVRSTTKINGVYARLRELSDDGKQAVFYLPLKAGGNEDINIRKGQTAKDLSTAKYSELSVNEFEWEVVRLCNIERAKEGLPSLSMIGTLQDVCDIREQEIEDTFSHTRPNGNDCYSAVPSTYESKYQGENIAQGQDTPKDVVIGWMNSKGHRANIMNPDYKYIGVGYNSDGHNWVQFFSGGKDITNVTKNISETEFTETALKDVYLTITASNGYVSYMPVSFDSMKEENGKYYPRLSTSKNVSFVKLEEDAPVQGNPNYVLTAGSLFEKFIPITHVYATNFFVDYNMESGTKRFSIGTRFLNETSEMSPTLATQVKRVDYQNHYVKVNYLGTYGTVGEEIAVNQLGIIKKEEYEKVMRGEESEWASVYNLTKDTIVISTEIYDENKKFVRKLSPACVIVATDAAGSFITFSKYLGASATNLFSVIDNFFAPDDDKSRQTKAFAFEANNLMLTSKAEAEKLLPATEKLNYEYVTHSKLEGNPQYNTNHILDDDEFVSPENVYYQVGVDFKTIDPVVRNEIRNVVSYSYYTHEIDHIISQRNIVTSDGTLYGVTSEGEKKIIAKNVKKTTANHYLTNNGEVKELNGKVVAKDVYDYEESTDGWIIGILKNDCSFYMGYTYIEGKDGYAKGISKMLDNVKAVVPNGLLTKDDDFYRWNNDIQMTGYDEDAFVKGEFISDWELNLGLVLVCRNAVRIFPHECLTKVWALSGDLNKKDSVYGFVQNKSGKLYGYSTTFNRVFGTYSSLVERIFPLYSSVSDGNFVGIKIEDNPYPDVIACRVCDSNIYRYGPLLGGGKYVCETQGGYYGEDGIVYGLQARPDRAITEDGLITFICTKNEITNNPNMFRKTATYRAYSRETETNIPLLPDVYTWMYDDKRITLLERTDGSVWMAGILHPSTNADLIAMLDGYESSNVFQVSPATTKKVDTEFIRVNEILSPAVTKIQFTDVPEDAWYTEPVKWAIDMGITNGTAPDKFSPNDTCTRAQILTFLWRAVGSPQSSKANPFKDVKSSDYFYQPALWAYEKGIVSGNVLSPNNKCTRGETVIYLYKSAGSPESDQINQFIDVPASNVPLNRAVCWAFVNNITGGTSYTTFSPNDTCTRGHIVTFLYRAFK